MCMCMCVCMIDVFCMRRWGLVSNAVYYFLSNGSLARYNLLCFPGGSDLLRHGL